MTNQCEFIFALATTNLRSALHLHRLSGNGIFQILSPYVFLPQSEINLKLDDISNKTVTRYVHIKNKEGVLIDDVVITLFPNPKSFTGEDVIEISTHGNPIISNMLHSLLRKIGLRDAKPGEFTQRAMLNGKLDLAQAEGINELIHAESVGAIELARNNLEGLLSKETLQIRNELVELLAYLEAHIDFAPDEVGNYEPRVLLPKIEAIKNKLTSLYSTYENGLKIREGLKIVLCGKPNSGKSSLYNALLKYDKAIVTNIPGTTRDVLEDKLLIENKEFILLDTAGIRETEDEVEKIGVSRSLERMRSADIICYLISLESLQSREEKEEKIDFNSFSFSENKKIVLVYTKKDLINGQPTINSEHDFVFVSQFDFEELKNKLLQYHNEIMNKTDTKKSPMLISQRQKDKVFVALQFVEECEKLILLTDYPEKIASLVNGAKSSLEEIVGEISVDNVFEKVFSTFCIGK
ncbi:MAG: tRNA uridine-5-carboxymethylaminomethyl(34) synthesis GTPase MnmE [Bdellovibrionota bacterium]